MPQIDQPVAGYYRTRLVRGGPWCAVRIWYGPTHDPETSEPLDRSAHWQATVNGIEQDAYEIWPWCCDKPIDEAEFRYLTGLSAHAKTWEPSAPEAQPTKRIDFNRTKPVF